MTEDLAETITLTLDKADLTTIVDGLNMLVEDQQRDALACAEIPSISYIFTKAAEITQELRNRLIKEGNLQELAKQEIGELAAELRAAGQAALADMVEEVAPCLEEEYKVSE